MFCLDWKNDADEIEIWGSEADFNFQYIAINITPCNFVPKGYDDLYPVADECIWDETA